MGRLTRPHWHWIDPTHQTKEHTLTCDMAHMGSAHHHITTTLEHCPQLSKPSIHVFVPIIRVYVHVHIASVPSSGRVHSRLGPRPLVRRPATLRGDDGCGECRGALIAPSPLAVVRSIPYAQRGGVAELTQPVAVALVARVEAHRALISAPARASAQRVEGGEGQRRREPGGA